LTSEIHIEIFNIDSEINDQSSIDDNVNNILIDDHDIGNGSFRSILDILKALIPI
jgi:hypothetical protein